MVPLKNAAVVVLACAVVAAGFGPVDHLHPATDVRSAVVHAHLEGGAPADTHSPSAVHDEHEIAVPLSRVMAGGQARHVVAQPCTLPDRTWVADVAASEPNGPDPEARPTSSPPPRPSAPRAPPA